jgi:hypothetical protein
LLGTSNAGPQQCCDPFLVTVIDGYLMTVLDEISGKSAAHMAETDHADTLDHELVH